MATTISNAARSVAADAIVDLVDAGIAAGKIIVYDGSQPAGPDSTIGAATALAEFTLADPAFGAAATGVATVAGTPLTATGAAAGTATWFRMLDSNNVAILDGSVTGTGGGGELELNTTTISVGVDIELTSGTVTMPGSS